MSTFCIHLDQLFGNILYFSFNFRLLLLPSRSAQLTDSRNRTFFACILSYFVHGMQADIDQVIVFINQAQYFLFTSINHDLAESTKACNPIIYMYYIVACLQSLDFSQSDGFGLGVSGWHLIAVVTTKQLMVCITGDAYLPIHKALAQAHG